MDNRMLNRKSGRRRSELSKDAQTNTSIRASLQNPADKSPQRTSRTPSIRNRKKESS